MEIFKVFKFDAAHRLPNVGVGHPCAEVHGHSFSVAIHVSGPVDRQKGWVIDFADIDHAFQPLLIELDHRYLNEIEGLNNPTSENIARWIWDRLSKALPQLSMIVVQESPESGCVYRGD
jgi:6-pyruvoyltetrahydropterin/6-carboxytetrahydropterin synthase